MREAAEDRAEDESKVVLITSADATRAVTTHQVRLACTVVALAGRHRTHGTFRALDQPVVPFAVHRPQQAGTCPAQKRHRGIH